MVAGSSDPSTTEKRLTLDISQPGTPLGYIESEAGQKWRVRLYLEAVHRTGGSVLALVGDDWVRRDVPPSEPQPYLLLRKLEGGPQEIWPAAKFLDAAGRGEGFVFPAMFLGDAAVAFPAAAVAGLAGLVRGQVPRSAGAFSVVWHAADASAPF